MSITTSKGTALITGASTGIGAVYADRLAKRGYDLILVARSEAQLNILSGRLTSETGRSVTPLRADLNDKADLAKVETTLRNDQTISMLVNNAGIGSITPPVLPAATATDLWEKSGLPYQNLPASIVMSPEDVVDAAPVALDQGELVTFPSLHDGDEWARFEAARRAISQHFGNSVPAPRYRIGVRSSA
jgi:short-subunit dehydrogenase